MDNSNMEGKESDKSTTPLTNIVSVDDVLATLKPLGKYQITSVICIFVGYIQIAHAVLIHVFIGYTPEFQCRNLSKPLSEYGIKMSNNYSTHSVVYDQCHITIKENGTAGQQMGCRNGYQYSTQQIRSTIVTEWDLVCDKNGLGELSQTLVMVGQMVGAIFLSPLPDRYGRKPVMVAGQVLAFALCVSASFSPTYAVFCVFRFLVGIVIQCVNTTAPVMCLELFSTEYRGFAGIINNTMWSTSVLSLTLFGYFLKDLSWRYIQLISALACVLCLFSFWTLNESLRWLVANNRRIEANVIVRKMASRNNVPDEKGLYLLEKIFEKSTISIESTEAGCAQDKELTVILPRTDTNDSTGESEPLTENKRNKFEMQIQKTVGSEDNGISLPVTPDTEYKRTIQEKCDEEISEREDFLTTEQQSDQEEHISYLDVFRNRKLLRNTLVLSLCWFSSGFGYMGLFLVPFSFTYDIYINFFINAIVEFPGIFIMLSLINRIGRRWLTMAYFGLAGVAIVVAVSILLLTSRSNETTKTIGAVVIYIGKFSISGVVGMLLIYTPELYPTNVRNIGYGITGCAGRLGAMTAPFLKILASAADWAPGAALSATFVLALCSLLLLPETKGKELPQSLHEFVLLEEKDKCSKLCKPCTCTSSC